MPSTAKQATSQSDVPTGQDRGRYEIRVSGHLASRWRAWFDGMTITRRDDGTTVIHGMVADQSALHGLLRKLNDIGVPLISVALTDPTALTHPSRTDPPQPKEQT